MSRLVSVETDLGWIGKLREMPAISEAERQGRLIFVHVDIGPVGKWGKPIDVPALLAMQHTHPRPGATAMCPMSYLSTGASAWRVPSRPSFSQSEIPRLRSTISGNALSTMSCFHLLSA